MLDDPLSLVLPVSPVGVVVSPPVLASAVLVVVGADPPDDALED